MIEILLIIEKVSYFTLFALVIFYALSTKRRFSLLITLTTVLLSEVLLKDLVEQFLPFIQPLLNPVLYKTAVYSLYTSTDLLAAFGILQLHKIYHESLGFGARQASLGLLCLALLQVAFFALSFFVERSVFVIMYLTTNASMGISITAMLFVCAIKDIIPFEISITREQKS